VRRLRRNRPATTLPEAPLHAALAPSTRQMVRNMILTADGTVWAGYRLGPARWDYTSLDAKAALLEAVADGWAHLLGRDLQERVTNRPHPVADWARRLDERTPHPADERLWREHLLRMQRRVGQAGMDDKIVYRYFTVGQIDPDIDLLGQTLAYYLHGTQPAAEVRKVLAEEKQVADAVGGPGWRAKRMTERDAGWLRTRSLAPGLPAPLPTRPEGWDEGDIDVMSNDVRWHEDPLARSVQVAAWRDGRKITRHAMVLTVSRMDDLGYPENGLDPWQAYAERATDPDGRPFAVEWNLVGRLMTGQELKSRSELDLNKADSIKDSYIAHGERPPGYTEQGIAVAEEAKNQIATGAARVSGRFVGSVNALVIGEDLVDENGRVVKPADEVAEERAAALRRLYGGNELRMELTVPTAQSIKLREFIPGEPVDRKGYQRQIRLDYLSAGLPNVSAAVGDDRGPYLGFTRGAARRPFFHDPHYATEGRKHLGRSQNCWLVTGTLGSGKSVLLGAVADVEAGRGIRVVVRDPSGPLMRLCEMPDLAPHATALNLLRGAPGTLSPPSLVREPRREEFLIGTGVDEDAYRQAVAEARGERRALSIDIARRCLEADLYNEPHTREVLRAAADLATEATGWHDRTSLWDLIAGLNRLNDPHALRVANALTSASQMPMLSLLFPPFGHSGEFMAPTLVDRYLTVISTPGIRRAPDGAPREDWSPAELAADPVMRLTAQFTNRLLFDKPMNERAVAIFDEAEDMTDTGAGRHMLNRLGRDHSKWNIAVYLGLKNVTDQMMGTELRNFVAGAFVGRVASREPAEAMLRVLNVDDRRYASRLMNLSSTRPGEFVHLDLDGQVGGIKVDLDYYPLLKEYLLTDPTPEGSDAWDLTEGGSA
jgi:hypothetical protein